MLLGTSRAQMVILPLCPSVLNAWPLVRAWGPATTRGEPGLVWGCLGFEEAVATQLATTVGVVQLSSAYFRYRLAKVIVNFAVCDDLCARSSGCITQAPATQHSGCCSVHDDCATLPTGIFWQ
jgi:hypothetical protein